MKQRRIGFFFAAVLGVIAAPAARAQSTIELRPHANLAPGAAVTLGQVAKLEGSDAIALAGVEVAPAAGATLSIDEVRKALEASGHINWGRIALRGSTCAISGPLADSSPKAAPSAPVAAVAGPDTLRSGITIQLARILRSTPEDLQLTFAPGDTEFLNTPISGRTVEVHPTAAADSMPLRIAMYQGDRMIGAERVIRVGVKVRRDVPIATASKRRGETLSSADYTTETRWLAPTARPATPEELAGAEVRGRIGPGEVIETDDVAPSVAVGKGDIVSVRCLAGGVIVATRARAVGPGRDGELIEFEALTSKRRFFARMDGKGRAIATADTPAPPEARDNARSLPVQGGRIPPPISTENSR